MTKRLHKSLIKIEDEPLILRICDQLKQAGLKDILVISGYQNRNIEKVVRAKARVVFNPFYRVSGILGSFWEARHYLFGKPFLFTTADHFFHPSVLTGCLGGKSDIRILVQRKKTYTKEDAKVIIANSKVVRMSKDILAKEASGEFGGMVFLSARASKLFFLELTRHLEAGNIHGYMMDVLMQVSEKYHLPVEYHACGPAMRIEIDSIHDLIQARRMARKFRWKRKNELQV